MKINKKGMLDDLFDLLFTIFVSFFALLLVGAILTMGIKDSHTKTISEITEFKKNDAALNNLRVVLYNGVFNLENVNIDKAISDSVLLNGNVITACQDYSAPEECNQNIGQLYLGADLRCFWSKNENKCTLMPMLGAGVEEKK